MTLPPSTALRLIGVSKKYRLFKSPGDRLKEALHPARKRLHEEFWAIKDVSLELQRGRTLGLLGLNGSGKSTLLQIIAGVLQPSDGSVHVHGRVAALLELGAGFNPELTARENVITNQLIMGLSQADATARLEEVRAFADIGRHFDQPVKTYSSGMFMRVAFAMSICVDPDILIIDEALAVGDAKFQEKCFRRLKEFQTSGRTILFVTHDRASVTQLCDEAVLLHEGRLVDCGAPKKVVDNYTELMVTGRLPHVGTPAPLAITQQSVTFEPASTSEPASSALAGTLEDFLGARTDQDRMILHPLYNANEQRWGNGNAKVVDALVLSEGRENPASVMAGAEVEVHVRVAFATAIEAPLVGMTLTNSQGVTIYGTHSGWLGTPLAATQPGDVRTFRFRLRLPLAVGAWFIELAAAEHQTEICDVRSRVLHLEIIRDRMLMGLVDLNAVVEETSPSFEQRQQEGM